jgi:hypothetical protein
MEIRTQRQLLPFIEEWTRYHNYAAGGAYTLSDTAGTLGDFFHAAAARNLILTSVCEPCSRSCPEPEFLEKDMIRDFLAFAAREKQLILQPADPPVNEDEWLL